MNFKACLLFMATLFVTSCNQRNDAVLLDVQKDQDLLSKYFMAATVGVVSANDELKYVFIQPLENDVSPDVLQKLISLDPHVDGIVSLSNNTILTFKPVDPLKPDFLYTVNINLKLLNNPRFKENISFKIKTFKQDFKVERAGLIINEDGSTSVQISVITADKVNSELMKSCFESDADEIKISEINTNSFGLEFVFKAGLKKTSFINYSGENIGCKTAGGVPLFDFDPKEFNVVYTYHSAQTKEFNVYFSQRLNKATDLTGLLLIQGKNASYTIKNNVVTFFLAEVRSDNIVKIFINKNIKSIEGKTLQADHKFDINMQVDQPAVVFVSDGNYFPSEGDFKIPVKTRALNELRVVVIEIKQENVMHYLAWQSITYADYYTLRMYGKPVYDQVVSVAEGLPDHEGWKIYGIDLSKQIQKNPGSIYHISLDFEVENTTLSCKVDLAKYQVNSKIPNQDYFNTKESYYNDYYYYNEDYRWEEQNDPCKLSFYVNKEPNQKIFICSDYAVIAKKGGSSYHIALSKLLDLSQVGDAEVSLYDLQAEKLSSIKTNSNGFAIFENIERDAAVLKVEKNKQITYLALDANQSNSLTEFDISGERSETETSFFAYSDRDVYRPGDSIFVDLMINKSQITLPNGLPIVMTFYNAENMIIDKQISNISLEQKLIYGFAMQTSKTAKTGLYRCIFQIGPQSVRKNIRIETIKPNTAETIYQFENIADNTIYDEFIKGSLETKYLTGFNLGNAKIKAFAKGRVLLKPFPDFSDFQFEIYNETEIDKNFDLIEAVTNENGSLKFEGAYSLKSFNSPVNVSIETELILPGGGTNKEGKSVNVSPFKTYIGANRKNGSGWNGNHTFNENIEVKLVNLTDRGKLSSKSNTISYTLQKHTNSWWVDKYRLRSSGNFVSNSYWEDIKSSEVKISGRGDISFKKNSLVKGAYRLRMTDTQSGHETEVFFTVYDGVEPIPGAQPYIVEFQTDKDSYKSGETINVSLPNFDDAKALISIERGNKIVKQLWFDCNSSNKIVKLTTDENWTPNVYIHVTIMQKYKQQSNDLPLRMYGIRYVKMDGTNTSLTPKTNIPDKLESNNNYSFTISESEGRPMEYTVSLVDEGLLNLTGFRTPDPVKHFNGKYPLLVKTWDTYQYLINFFRGKFAGIISIGGDDAYNPDAIAEVNRFKPIAIHLGSFKVDKNGSNVHNVYIPNYIGKVRLMVVACNANNFGKLEKFIPVKNPLMVQSQIPRSLNITDKIQLPVMVFRDDMKISQASLKAKADPTMVRGLEGSKNIVFGNKNQVSHDFNIEVLKKTGKLSLEFSIDGGGKSMKESTDILINYPNSYESDISKNIVEIGGKLDIKLDSKGFKEVFASQIMISGLKLPNFTQYSGDLIEYPYGCLEQTTSKGFGQLYLDKILQLNPLEARERLENLQAVINKLTVLQQSSGKFNYWDNSYYHAWSDIYAGSLLIEMQRLGYLTSKSDVVDRWVNAHSTSANNWAAAELADEYSFESESLTQAFRLFVLAKAGKPAKSAMNRFVTSNKSKYSLTWWLMAGSFQLSGLNSKAKELLNKAESLQIENYVHGGYGSFGDKGRDLAAVVEVLSFFGNEKQRLDDYFDKMVEVMNAANWVSTHTKGYAFLAAYSYFGTALLTAEKANYTVTGLSTIQNFQHSSFEPNVIRIEKSNIGKTITIQNKGKGKLFVYKTDRFIDTNLNRKAVSSNLGISVDYKNITRGISSLSGVKLGDDIIINVRVTNPSALENSNLVLNVKMPAGLELINPRLYETSTNKLDEGITFQDFKDDRVYTFFNMSPGQNKYFSFRTKAAFSGDFYMPSVDCENMYKGNVRANTEAQRILISK